MGRKPLTHEEFMEKFYIKNENAENIEILGEYEGGKIKIKCKCKIDNHIWYATPNSLLKGHGCPKCKGRIRGVNQTLTHEEFMEKFMEKNKNAENIEIVGKYVNARTKIKCKCKIDGYEWETVPNSLLNGTGCLKCYDKRRNNTTKLTHEEFTNRIKEINDDIEILGEYVNNHTKIKCKCKIDECIWYAIPNSLLSNHGCPKCKINKQIKEQTKTHEEFIQEIKEINDNIEILGEYKDGKTKIKCRCKIDNHTWYATPSNLLSNHGCPKCNASKGEKRIVKYLDNRNIKYKEQYKFKDCKFKQKLPFDFYIPSLNTIIEYDGEFHYKIINNLGGINTLIDTKIRDTVKTIYCKENNIKLIRIPYWDFDRIEEILDRELEEK